ncbi:hypothetical protein TNCV_2536471 [Trichonephila clavipes]|nr:hypothetical protein TNCV_2536471 [Trichonephila clavipes]
MNDPSLPRARSACPHVKWCTEVDAIDHVGSSYPPDSTVRYPHYRASQELLLTNHVILNNGQVTWMTSELAPPSRNYHTKPTGGRFSFRQI